MEAPRARYVTFRELVQAHRDMRSWDRETRARSTALLELKLVEQGPFPDEASARQAFAGNVPPDLQILPGASVATPGAPPSTVYYAVRRVGAVTGRDLRNARQSLDSYFRAQLDTLTLRRLSETVPNRLARGCGFEELVNSLTIEFGAQIFFKR
jgi:hypothetical protein